MLSFMLLMFLTICLPSIIYSILVEVLPLLFKRIVLKKPKSMVPAYANYGKANKADRSAVKQSEDVVLAPCFYNKKQSVRSVKKAEEEKIEEEYTVATIIDDIEISESKLPPILEEAYAEEDYDDDVYDALSGFEFFR